jgi:hypothetical protein
VPTASAKVWFASIGGTAVAPGELVRTEIAGCAILKPKCSVLPGVAAGTYHLAARLNGRGPWLSASAAFTVTG